MQGTPVFDSIGIVGMGLLGGSIGLAAQERGSSVRYFDPAVSAPFDRAGRLADLEGVDLWVVATPVAAYEGVAEEMAAIDGGLVIDVGSTKQPFEAAFGALRPSWTAVGTHPMAGQEAGGFENARADLVAGETWFLDLTQTPTEPAHSLVSWVLSLGASAVSDRSQAHDEAVIYASQLFHLVAGALVSETADAADALGPLARSLAMGSYRSGTRVATANPAFRRDLLAQNPRLLGAAAQRFGARLSALGVQLADGEIAGVHDLVDDVRRVNDAWEGAQRSEEVPIADMVSAVVGATRQGERLIEMTPNADSLSLQFQARQ